MVLTKNGMLGNYDLSEFLDQDAQVAIFFNWRVSGITPLDLRHPTTTEVTDVRPRPLATGTTLPTETHRPPLGQTGGEGAPTGGEGHPPPGQRGATAGDHPPLPALTEVTPGSIVTIGTTMGLHPAVETFHRTGQ